ncbi:MAG TPA: AMP-binding protein [Steroidobacter sp.]|uniref:class I adenylate-forming enzyme family protein n=1 Tax=Steroidobacter sp. TaxID=1978227 RepID=UPI002ED8FE16
MTAPNRRCDPLLLSSGLHAVALRFPSKPALLFGQITRTYAELATRVRRVCGLARSLGLRKGDRVAVFAPNCAEYLELVAGLADAGLIVATLNARSTAHELAAACDDCEARVLFVHSQLAGAAHEARFKTVERIIILGEEYEGLLRDAPECSPVPDIEETDPFALVYSSGTTGKPKGILISHRSRVLTFHAMAMEYGCYGPDDYQLGIAPMAHGAGFAFIMASVFFGGTVKILPSFDPMEVVATLASEPFTSVFMVPTHFHAIFAAEKSQLDRYRGKATTLKSIISNASALPQTTKEKIVAYWGEGLLHETYGSTEAGIVTNLRPRFQLIKRQSVGPAFALNCIRLLDDDGREVGPGEVGELFSRSPYVFNGYWNQPEETAKALRDGWVTAGDLARRDEDGFHYIVDRKKDMVVTGGFNVYPREVEEVLHRHPALLEAAVVGTPDEYFGEALCAFLVVRQGMHVSADELQQHCREMLSGYKVPKHYRFVASLPKNAGGKVLKTALSKSFIEETSRAAK